MSTQTDPSRDMLQSANNPGKNGEAVAEVRQQMHVDDSKAATCYANFCRVTGTPEEVILDLALNPQLFGVSSGSVAVSQRIVCNYYTAKRLLGALHLTIQRHEQAFGVLETDVQKRVQQPTRR